MELVDASTKNVDLVYQLAYGKEAKILILFGAGFANLVEPRGFACTDPLLVVRKHSLQWKRPGINLDELARLRFEQGWTLQKLTKYFRCDRRKLKRLLETLNGKETTCP